METVDTLGPQGLTGLTFDPYGLLLYRLSWQALLLFHPDKALGLGLFEVWALGLRFRARVLCRLCKGFHSVFMGGLTRLYGKFLKVTVPHAGSLQQVRGFPFHISGDAHIMSQILLMFGTIPQIRVNSAL